MKNWAALTISGALSALLGFLWTLSASRLLVPAEYADFAAAASLIFFVGMASGPLSQSIAYFVATGAPGSAIRAAQRTVFRASLAAAVLFVVASPFVAYAFQFRSPRPLLVVAACAVILLFAAVRRGFVQGLGTFTLYSLNISLEAILRLALLFAAAAFFRDATFALLTYAVAAAVALLLLPIPAGNRGGDAREIFRYFSRALPASVIFAALLYGDIVLVKLFADAGQAALYAAASFVAKGVGMFVVPVYVYAVPQLAGATTLAERRQRFARICLGFAALETLAIAGLFALRRPIVAILLGRGYAAAADLVVPISIAVALAGLTFIALQLPASRARFDFLPWYAAGCAIEIVAVTLRHDSLRDVILAIIAAQAVTLALVAPKIVRSLRD